MANASPQPHPVLSKLEDWVFANKKPILIVGLILTCIYLLAPLVFNYTFGDDFEKLLHNNLGLSRSLAKFLSIPLSFVQAALMPAALSWFFWGRSKVISFVAVMVVFGTAPLLHALLDTNFNQRTGAAQKYYVRHAGGEVILSDTGGVDPSTGIERRILTQQVAQAIEREKRGIRPRPVVGDLRSLTYFDVTTGAPLIWFSKGQDGEYHLFNAEGFNPDDGTLLQPVNEQVVAQITKAAILADREARLAEQRRAEAAAQERTAKARLALKEELGVSSFPPNAFVLGAKPVHANDQASEELARHLLDQLDDQLRARRLHTAQFPIGAYSSPAYNLIMDGRMDALADTELTENGRVVIAITVEADCNTASSVAGLISCGGRATVRLASGTLASPGRTTWVEQGAGVNRSDALAQTAEFLVQRHVNALLEIR